MHTRLPGGPPDLLRQASARAPGTAREPPAPRAPPTAPLSLLNPPHLSALASERRTLRTAAEQPRSAGARQCRLASAAAEGGRRAAPGEAATLPTTAARSPREGARPTAHARGGGPGSGARGAAVVTWRRGRRGALRLAPRMRGADASAAVSAAASAAALWGEHGSFPRGGGCLLGSALADEAARGALLRQGSGRGRPVPRSAGEGGREDFGSAQLSGLQCPGPAGNFSLLLRGSRALRPFTPRAVGLVLPSSSPRPTPRSPFSGLGRGAPRCSCPSGSAGLRAGPRRCVPLPSAWRSGASSRGPLLSVAFPLAGRRARGAGPLPVRPAASGLGSGRRGRPRQSNRPRYGARLRVVPLGPRGAVVGREAGRQAASSLFVNSSVPGKTAVLYIVLAKSASGCVCGFMHTFN